MSIGHLLNDTVEITRYVNTTDSAGSPIQTKTTQELNVPARVQPVNLAEKVKMGREESGDAYNFYIETIKDITEDDLIFWRNNYYQVKSRSVYPDVYIKAYAEQVK